MTWSPKQIVVVPVDFSDDSRLAVDTAMQLAAGPESVHVVHVLPELAPSEPMVLWEAWESQKRHQHAEEELRKFLAGEQYAGLQLHVFVGDPGQEITALAERLHAELIVLPSHGRTGLKRLLIGSVAERVVRLAHCPVLVLRK